MTSRAVVLHDKSKTTPGGLTAKKLMVSPSSQEVVSRAKRRQGLKSPWARATEACLKELRAKGVIKKDGGIVLMNVGKEGKALYACAKEKSQT